MQSNDIDINRISTRRMDRLLEFLPEFTSPDTVYATGGSAEKTGPKEFMISFPSPSDRVIEFIEVTHREEFVQSFDWMAWSEEHRDAIAADAVFDDADLELLIRVITTHVRADRFAEGHLTNMLESGTIGRILLRLQVLRRRA